MNMQFLNSTQNIQYNRFTQSNSYSQSLPTMMSRRKNIPMSNIAPIVASSKNVPLPNDSSTPKMVWGPAIWFLLHTLAEKIKEDAFLNIRVELLNNIYAICTHLPCPICSEHAKEYLGKINFNTITTKVQLKYMLFNFHNEVNNRKGYPIFNIDELNEKYLKANTINIIQNFMIHFKDKHRSPKLMADDLQRARIASSLQEWFRTNIIYFD